MWDARWWPIVLWVGGRGAFGRPNAAWARRRPTPPKCGMDLLLTVDLLTLDLLTMDLLPVWQQARHLFNSRGMGLEGCDVHELSRRLRRTPLRIPSAAPLSGSQCHTKDASLLAIARNPVAQLWCVSLSPPYHPAALQVPRASGAYSRLEPEATYEAEAEPCPTGYVRGATAEDGAVRLRKTADAGDPRVGGMKRGAGPLPPSTPTCSFVRPRRHGRSTGGNRTDSNGQ